ncbi:MAG: hypothetical protein GC187_04210 [Alphaproteobacteria bacterium]|nr:hypothetical protein [Alphaproteobacteria bacterium]
MLKILLEQIAARAGALAAALSAGVLIAAPAFSQDAEVLFAQGERLLAEANELSSARSDADKARRDQLRGEAQTVLRQACELEHIEACKSYGRSLGVASFFDEDVYPERLWALGRACERDDGEGCLMLGRAQAPIGMFGAPKTPENWAGATAALTRACDGHEIAEACARLSQVLGAGDNPNRDSQGSLAYRTRACALGYLGTVVQCQ